MKKNVFQSPEMRIFWVSLPLIAVGIGLGLFYLPPFLKVVNSGILVLIAGVVFLTSFWVARSQGGGEIERNELKSIVANISDALIVYDQKFTILFFNPAAEKLFQVKASAVQATVLTPQDAEKPELRLLAQSIFPSLAPTMVPRSPSGAYPQVVDLSFTDPEIELRVTTSPIADDRGMLFGFMKAVRDRTHEISLLRAKTEFIATASHQLRTPLSEVKWAVELIAQEPGLSENGKTVIENTVKSVTNLANLVDDLLNATRIEEGRFGYAFEQANLVEFLGKVLADAQPHVAREGIKLYYDRPEEPLPAVTIDPSKLSMVVTNLVDNATRYNVPNGEITVRIAAAKEGPYLEVGVKDTGIGIAPESIKKLFTKFFRADDATVGTGLGLYIAKNIIQAHGGQMWVESEPNRGTTVHFTIPTDPTLVPTKEVAVE